MLDQRGLMEAVPDLRFSCNKFIGQLGFAYVGGISGIEGIAGDDTNNKYRIYCAMILNHPAFEALTKNILEGYGHLA